MELSQAQIQKEIEELSNLTSSSQMLKALKQVDDAPEDQRSQLAEKLITPKALASEGAPMPKDLRISLRVFEEPTNKGLGEYTYDTATGEQSVGTPTAAAQSTTVCVSAGFYVCVSVGHTTQRKAQ
jgi:hypothetical protein